MGGSLEVKPKRASGASFGYYYDKWGKCRLKNTWPEATGKGRPIKPRGDLLLHWQKKKNE